MRRLYIGIAAVLLIVLLSVGLSRIDFQTTPREQTVRFISPVFPENTVRRLVLGNKYYEKEKALERQLITDFLKKYHQQSNIDWEMVLEPEKKYTLQKLQQLKKVPANATIYSTRHVSGSLEPKALESLLKWVANGGHYMMESENFASNTLALALFAPEEEHLEATHVEPDDSPSKGLITLKLDETPFTLGIPETDAYRLSPREDLQLVFGIQLDNQGQLLAVDSDTFDANLPVLLAHYQYQHGSITLVPNTLLNGIYRGTKQVPLNGGQVPLEIDLYQLAQHDHAAFLWYLTQRPEGRNFYFLDSLIVENTETPPAKPSFSFTFKNWKHTYWLYLIPLFGTFCLMWRYAIRMGPVRPLTHQHRPGFRDWLQGIAGFHLRHRHYRYLFTPVQQQVLQQLNIALPSFPRFSDVLELAQWCVPEVERALLISVLTPSTDPLRRTAFIEQSQILLHLQTQLRVKRHHISL